MVGPCRSCFLNRIMLCKLSGMPEKKSDLFVVKDLFHSLKAVVKSERRLADLEFQLAVRRATRHAILAAVFSVVAITGILALVSFLVIGIGELLNDNYWASSLLVAVATLSLGIPLALYFSRKTLGNDFSFPYVKKSLFDIKDISDSKNGRTDDHGRKNAA